VGNFYKNVTLLGPAQADVAAVLLRHRRTAYLTPSRAGAIVVYDLDSDEIGDPSELGDIALTLSQELACLALAAAVYDDDDLLLGLYDKGSQIGEYNSSGPSTLGAAELCRRFDALARTPAVATVLQLPRMLLVFESFRHRLLLKALRLPESAFAAGYKYIQQGEPPPGIALGELLHIGETRKWQPRATR
jgi:hypothetical protein